MTAPTGSNERALSEALAEEWRIDHMGGPKAGTETHYASSEAEADSMAADLVRLHGGRAVVWWEGWKGSEETVLSHAADVPMSTETFEQLKGMAEVIAESCDMSMKQVSEALDKALRSEK